MCILKINQNVKRATFITFIVDLEKKCLQHRFSNKFTKIRHAH